MFLPVVLLTAGFLASQNNTFNEIKSYIDAEDWLVADSLIRKIEPKSLSRINFSDYSYFKGVIYFNNGLYDQAFESFKTSEKVLTEKKNDFKLAQTISYIIQCVNFVSKKETSISTYETNQSSYIDTFCRLAERLDDYKLQIDCQYFKGTLAIDNIEYEKGFAHYKAASQIAIRNRDSIKYYSFLFNEAMYIGSYGGHPKDAREIYSDIIPFFIKNYDTERHFGSLVNISLEYYFADDLQNAIKTIKDADTIDLQKDILDSKQILHSLLSQYFEKDGNFRAAYQSLKKSDSLKEKLKKDDQEVKVKIIEEDFNNQKLRADNLEIEGKRKQTRNLLFGALVFILFGGLTAFLLQKNTKRKQKLAEQQKELETQKLTTVLKEQELMAIDAMIEGQEKERQRIANDLHDDLGGLMATMKLHFNALKDKQTPELFDKTTALIDDAYNKVRTIAHAKNSGVIAKQGLLVAVNQMAEKVSASNKIQIQVLDHGLENRLENSLELTIFRIIQELTTNIIKHAEATEASIHITNHEDSLNIMVEDNGKGFNPSQITKTKKGMGISSIDKRVEHLNGKMTIESEPKKGTTIIIDIPL